MKINLKRNKELWGTIGQYGSGCLLLIGIIIELLCHAHLGFIFISTGGLMWGIATKLVGH